MPRTFLNSGFSVGRLPAMIPVLHSVLRKSVISNRLVGENVVYIHDPDCEVCIVPEEVTGATVARENR